MQIPEDQLQQMARWRLLPKWRQLDIFDRLLINEFEDYQLRQQRIHLRLGRLLEFCQQHVPYYRKLLAGKATAITAEQSLSLLSQLPVMDRAALQGAYSQLRAEQLPSGERLGGLTETSGSTGQPVKVLHSLSSLRFFSFLKQREYRWWGVDPMSRLAIVRGFEDLPLVDNQPLAPGVNLPMGGWPQLSLFFQTGPAVAMSDVTQMEVIVDWLGEYQPSMLLGMAAVLECIALAAGDKLLAVDRVLSISQQLPLPMEQLIAQNLSASVSENYGCNEIGLIASRCPVSHRFHIHVEHALVEILNDDDSPCAEGESGRLVVTGLNNPAMPLLRYDTGDYARRLGHRCECGRTLPSFDQLFGRYRRLAHLPSNTWRYWDSVLKPLADSKGAGVHVVRQYQLQQRTEHHYLLRLVLSGAMDNSLEARIQQSWREVDTAEAAKLDIIVVDKIERTGKKVQDFISDL
jgi:phenylacetate-coenzyme A ligase PaaK-like adenylate-forming protein